MTRVRKSTYLLLTGIILFLLGGYISKAVGWEPLAAGPGGAAAGRYSGTWQLNRQFAVCRSAVAAWAAQVQPGTDGIDWAAVGRALGKPLLRQMQGGMYSAVFVRNDLHVVAKNVPVKSEMGVASELSFIPIGGGRAYLMGELTVTENELDAVTQALSDGGLGLTSMHKHLPAETPRIWWVHVAGYADPVAMAATVRAALQRTGTPASSALPAAQKMPFDTKALDRVMGLQGQVTGGVYKYLAAHRGSYRDTLAHLQLSPMMQPTAALYFQPLGGTQVAINGDLMMTADEVDGVTAALRQHHINLVALHSHMTHEYPQLYYLHYWQTGDAATLGRALRAALDKTATEQADLAGLQGD